MNILEFLWWWNVVKCYSLQHQSFFSWILISTFPFVFQRKNMYTHTVFYSRGNILLFYNSRLYIVLICLCNMGRWLFILGFSTKLLTTYISPLVKMIFHTKYLDWSPAYLTFWWYHGRLISKSAILFWQFH